MSRSRLLVALSCLGAASMLPASASAQPEKPTTTVPTEGEVELAKKLYREGKELRVKGELQKSLDKLKAAHDLVPTPITRLEYAQGLILLGNLVEGHALLVAAVTMPRDANESDKARRARDDAAKLAPKVDARIPRLVLEIGDEADGTAPAGERAKLELDGRAIRDEELGAPMLVNAGEHVLKVIAPASTRTERFRIDESETRTIAVATRTTPGSTVATSGRSTADGQRERERATARPPGRVAPEAPASESGGMSPLVPIGFVLGAVGVTTGAITGTVALVAADKVKDNCRNLRCPPEYHADLDLSTYMGTTATVAFVVGGAGLVVGTIALFAGSDPEPAITRAPLSPVIGPGYAGLGGVF